MGNNADVIRRLISLGVIASVLLLGDVAARGFVEAAVNARAKVEAPPGSEVSAEIGGFPFVPPLLLGGKVSKVDVHITNLDARVIVFAEVDVDLREVTLDRGRLINDRKARITAIDRGTVTATITEEALSNALRGAPVRMTDGAVTVAGVRVTPSTKDGKLALGGLTIPATDFVPCATDVTVSEGRMEFSCEIHDVPPALLDAVQDAVDP